MCANPNPAIAQAAKAIAKLTDDMSAGRISSEEFVELSQNVLDMKDVIAAMATLQERQAAQGALDKLISIVGVISKAV
jgi:hypothetical protein